MKKWKIHECDNIPVSGIQIVFNNNYSGRDIPSWQLHVTREATEEDLDENHHLEEPGEIIWQTIVEISHCPYCGSDLYNGFDVIPEEIGSFRHYDFSSWASKVV